MKTRDYLNLAIIGTVLVLSLVMPVLVIKSVNYYPNFGNALKVLEFVLSMGFFYAIYTKRDFKTIGIMYIIVFTLGQLMYPISDFFAVLRSSFSALFVVQLIASLMILSIYVVSLFLALKFINNKDSVKPSIIISIYSILGVTLFLLNIIKRVPLFSYYAPISILSSFFFSSLIFTLTVISVVLLIRQEQLGYMINLFFQTFLFLFFLIGIMDSILSIVSVGSNTMFLYLTLLAPTIVSTYNFVLTLIISLKEINKNNNNMV